MTLQTRIGSAFRHVLWVGMAVLGVVTAGLAAALWFATSMPGRSFRGPVPDLTGEELRLRDRLERHVIALSLEVGVRQFDRRGSLEQAASYIGGALTASGYEIHEQTYTYRGESFVNVEAILRGALPRSIVVGAHYDTAADSPGANDNASGVAVMLESARALRGAQPQLTVRFVAFANEEPPYFDRLEGMGRMSYVEALDVDPENVEGMISMDSIGYYDERAGSQSYPLPMLALLYPSVGNYVAFVGNLESRYWLRRSIGAFRSVARVPSEGIALPASIPGVAASDHRSFWLRGVPGILVTDTAEYRDPAYHSAADFPNRLDYRRMTHISSGVTEMLRELAGIAASGR